jgi:ABC-2 type transport system ATP-binding protein
MSITVENISKQYGNQKALNDVSFNIKSGEIVGFLGPNGAGKSTMMKILTCFIPQNQGKATVCGFDTIENSLEIRKKVGYLPEHTPLYLDLYIKEYLEIVGGIHHTKNLKSRIADIIEMTGITKEQNKKIGQLSKGYRQRVGLAQALIHDPEVLILDEPTTGLDPNQLTEIRALIKEIGKSKTIMLSTHIMQEVEAICDRVIIINKGEIVADKKSSELKDLKKGATVFKVEFDKSIEENQLRKIEGVANVKKINGNFWELQSHNNIDIRTKIFEFGVKNNYAILTLQTVETKLEDIFKELTKK